MDILRIKKINDVYVRITSEPHVEQELSDFFKFEVATAKFMPKGPGGRRWNGNIFLYSMNTKLLYAGLLNYVKLFCKERDIKIEYLSDFSSIEFSVVDAEKFINYIKPNKIPRDYQIEAFVNCVRNHRALTLMPTGSGKSFTIYLLSRLYTINSQSNRKFLVIVPTVSLVHQMAKDFIDYGADPDTIHRITAGETKVTDKQIVITTWQSIVNLERPWFKQFKAVVVDEAHQAKANSFKKIMTKLVDCKYRFGFTGTLDNIECHKLIIEGLTGPTKKIISTAELINRKQLADLNIKILVLKHDDDSRQKMFNQSYHDEMDFLVRNENRNKFIKNLILSLKGNTLVLYQYVDKHGKELYDSIKNAGIPCFFVHGGVDGEERDEIRKIVEQNENSIIIASYGTMSTGTNIVKLNNVICASPTKSKIRILQTIGRGLRRSEEKTSVTVFDIADDLTFKKKKNHTLNHLFERVKNYNDEKFVYKIYDIQLSREAIADKN